jgi:hypothetical protein
VEEPALLAPVDRIIGGVEIEGDPRRRLVLRLEEQLDEQVRDRRPVVADAAVAVRAGRRVLKPVQRALAGERRQPRALGLQPAEHRAEHRIAAQVVVVDQVLVAERDAEHPLPEERRQLMRHPPGIAAVAEAGGEALHQPDRPIGGAEQQRAGIGADRSAVEISHQIAAIEPCKQHRFRATLRLHRGCS